MEENILDIPDAFNRFKRLQGLHPNSGIKLSEYVTLVKARKIIRQITDGELKELNETVFSNRLNKFNKWTCEKLLSKLDMMPHLKLMRFLYVKEKEGIIDALLCLLNKKAFGYDQKFLTNYFKYGTALKPEGGRHE